MESRGFPPLRADGEYATYFEKIFGDDKERQRRYLKKTLSEDSVSLSVGSRVIGAMIASGHCRAVFTTNFDSVVEDAVAEMAGQSLAAYHLEGSRAANLALNNEEYPIYCKLHGDFRYESLKNLPADLATQNAALSQCLVNAGNRFGFIVAGYSGRDLSIMALFHQVLETNNPFPHGLFWTGIKDSPVRPAVEALLKKAKDKGVRAEFVPIETFDALLLRLWRNIVDKPSEMDAKVRKVRTSSVRIPLPHPGRRGPIVRLNALPVISIPKQCLELSFSRTMDWEDLDKARAASKGQLILAKGQSVFCWGTQDLIRNVFGKDLLSIKVCDLPADLTSPQNLYFKGFVEEAVCKALARGKPLLSRMSRSSAFLIANPHANAQPDFKPLRGIVGKILGTIAGLFAPVTEHQHQPEQLTWAEAVRVSIDFKGSQLWLLFDPDVWIWPPRARSIATNFLDQRRGDRFNDKYNNLLDAWIHLALGTDKRNEQVTLSAFDEGSGPENPSFKVLTRTGFTRRLTG